MERASFWVNMSSDFERHLQVPADFIENFNGKTPQICTIRSALCKWKEWEVEMVKVTDNSLFFGKGWEIFVEDNSVEKGNLLVFKYCGGAAFYAKIYGKNHCEIVPVQRKLDYGTTDHAAGVGNKNKNNFNGESSVYHEESNHDDSQTVTKAAKYSAGASIRKELVDLRNKPVEDAIQEFTGKDIHTLSQLPCKSSGRANEVAGEGNNGGCYAEGAQENPPSFKLVMTNSNLPSCKGASLHVPAEFCNSYFAEIKGDSMVSLTVDGSSNQWPVKYLAASRRLSGGWIGFSRDNCLSLDDECVFEVVNEMPITFKVTIQSKTK